MRLNQMRASARDLNTFVKRNDHERASKLAQGLAKRRIDPILRIRAENIAMAQNSHTGGV